MVMTFRLSFSLRCSKDDGLPTGMIGILAIAHSPAEPALFALSSFTLSSASKQAMSSRLGQFDLVKSKPVGKVMLRA